MGIAEGGASFFSTSQHPNAGCRVRPAIAVRPRLLRFGLIELDTRAPHAQKLHLTRPPRAAVVKTRIACWTCAVGGHGLLRGW